MIGDPTTLNVICTGYSVDIPTTEVWTYTYSITSPPITATNNQPAAAGVHFYANTADNTLANSYSITVTATLDTGETNNAYVVLIHVQRITPPVIPNVLYYVRDPTHTITIPKYDIYPFLGETLTYLVTKPDDTAIDTSVFTPTSLATLDPIITIDINTLDNNKKNFYDFKVTATLSTGIVDTKLTF